MTSEYQPISPSRRPIGDLEVPDSSRVRRDVEIAPITLRTSAPSSDLSRLLGTRRSSRKFATITEAALHDVLVRTLRPRGRAVGPDGYVERFKPFPSAGARHPHTLLVLVNDVDGMTPGAWIVDEEQLQLVRVDHAVIADELGHAVRGALRASVAPPATIVTMARWRRMTSKYPGNWGNALVWRDAGILLGTMHLVTHDLGLASAIVGIGLTTELPLGAGDEVLVDTGALALGSKHEIGG